MKNSFLLLLLFTAMGKAQIVNIPDANFKAKLLAADTTNSIAMGFSFNPIKIDANSDGEIQNSEAMVVGHLNISSAFISDLTGISSFLALRGLNCSHNTLSIVDFSGNFNLNSLNCSYNQLTQIDLVTGLTFLDNIDCSHNLLASLNVQNAPALKDLDCSFNQLTSLDFTGIHYFWKCYLNDNLLTNLTFHYQTQIILFNANNNQFQDLDFSNVYFTMGDLFEQEVSFTGNPLLRWINIKNGGIETGLFYNALNSITTWEFICADENEVSQVELNQPTAVVNTYCSFTPGGDYNTITGNLKYDANNNGCDSGDSVFPNMRVDINDGTTVGSSFTSNAGNYAFYTPAGSFDVTPAIENLTWFTVSPATVSIPFANSNNNAAVQDFCIAPNGTHPDLESVISSVIPARPGFDAQYKIVYRNKGNTIMPAESLGIILHYDTAKLDYISSSQPLTFNGTDSISFGYPTLQPFESRSIGITFHVHSPIDINPVNINDVLTFTSEISPTDNDENQSDNSFSLHQTVVGAYDPNSITCLEGAVVSPSEIGNYLHYAVNFENTGTFEAESIVVKTIVDTTQFNINSLQLMNTSHAVDARITGNKVEFIFKNIELPIGGHGHILLKIKTKSNLVTGDQVAKRADIFFDYNAPVDTGLANTVFQNLSNTQFEVDPSVVVYPNPANNEVTIKAANTIQSIQLFDVQGRIILTSLVGETESKLNISGYSKGIYFIKIITEKGSKVQKLLKE